MKKEGNGIYLYCISDSKLELNKIADKDPSFFWINYNNLNVLAKEVSLTEFEGHISEDDVDFEWLKQKTKNHEAILEKIMEEINILPASFGTVLKEVKDCKRLLKNNYEIFRDSLNKIEDKKEWKLKITVDIDILEEKIYSDNKEVKNLEEKIKKKSSGTAYMLKKKLNNLIEEKKKEHLSRITNDVEKEIEDIIEDSVTSEESKLKKNKEKREVIFNRNYLISQKKEEKFIELLENIDEKYRNKGFEMKLIGPWPVYSFVPNIETGG